MCAAPTEKEKEILKKFLEAVNDALYHEEHRQDPFLLRWLRARDHDLDKSEKMLRASLEWRRSMDVDKILSKPFDPWVSETFPYWIDSTSKYGHPVLELPLGAWDVRKAVDKGLENEFQQHVCRFFEDVLQKIREGNKGKKKGEWPNTQWLCVVDWKGYSYAQLAHWKGLQNTLKMAATYEAHYPEVLYKAVFINCPAVFPLFMRLLKRIIAPKTVEKIQCYKAREEWEPLLLEEIGEENLGHPYGGKKIRKIGGELYGITNNNNEN